MFIDDRQRMSIRFEVKRYIIRLARETSNSKSAMIICAEQIPPRRKLILNFYKNPKGIPRNSTVQTEMGVVAQLNLPEDKYLWYVDLLRNEKPVFVHIDLDDPAGHMLTNERTF
ncbi:MAG: hypothetical protein ACTSQI_11280 [Candidatus Helarchaeota archaeon]